MFYSETLLSKTGPLARVWLSANLERKLSKTHILQSNIETSVGAIVGQDQAPMALRLSGQLLLGVVRIYSRKARYLLEDCNEALMKIKMAFRPGNVDLPAGATAHTAAQLTLPDVITELDLLLPDPTMDLGDLDMGDTLTLDPKHKARNKITLDDEQYIESQVGRGVGQELLEMEEDLGIDIGEDFSAPAPRQRRYDDLSDLLSEPEIGRRAPSEAGFQDDLFSDTRMTGMELEEPEKGRRATTELMLEEEIDLGLGDDTGLGFAGDLGFGDEGDTTMQAPEPAAPEAGEAEKTPVPEELPRSRSGSPLSSVRSSVERELSARVEGLGADLDVTFVDEATRLPSEDIEEAHAAPSRKRKVVVDSITEIKAKQIKAQQADRSRILRDPSFLPRDPTILALTSLTKSGRLPHSVFYPKNIAPELVNLLAPDFVKRMAEMKRKREASDEEEVEEGRPSPPKQARLELEEHEEEIEQAAPQLELEEEEQGEMMELPEDLTAGGFGEMSELEMPAPRLGASSSPQPEIFPQSEEPEPIPEQEGEYELPQTQVISRETRNAVHVLREQFSEPNPKSSVIFQELLPPQNTTRVDATKMFFECLVLATKDAIKVVQKDGFDEIEIKQKKALWGAWAEEKDEQQIAEELEQEQEKAAMTGRRHVVATGRTLGEATAAA